MIARASQGAFAERLDYYCERVNNKLKNVVAGDGNVPARLRSAMEYAVLGPGKTDSSATFFRDCRVLRTRSRRRRFDRRFGSSWYTPTP